MPDPAKVLIAVSADFGELANALYLLDGASINAHLLLPPRLYQKNQQSLPRPASEYRSVDDLLAAMHLHKPQALLLFSGYLFGINQLLAVAELSRLIQEAHRMGIRIATTDPFLGLLAHLTDTTFIHPQKTAITAHFAAVEKTLRDVPHLYVSPMPPDSRTLAFYNPRLVLSPTDRAALPAFLPTANIVPSPPHWLFILSLEDYVSQCSLHGRAAFDERLFGLLSQALAAGRRPVLLAPQPARDSLGPRLPKGATLLDFSSHALFRAWLLTAEHVFFWNIVSNSILARVANAGSLFFFDFGHLARSIPSAVPLAMRSYYANACLPMLDASLPLNAAALARQAQSQPATFAPALAAFRALPSPENMLATLLATEQA